MKNFALLSVVSIFAFTPAAAQSLQDLCSVVLTEKAYDTANLSTNTRLMNSQKDAICRDEYENLGEARAKAGSAGFSAGIGNFSIGANGAEKKNNGKWDISETSFCKSTLSDLREELDAAYNSTVASVAVRAWQDCVNSSQENSMFLSYKYGGSRQSFGGIFSFSINTGALQRTITAINVPPSQRKNVHCSIGNQVFSPETIEKTPYVVTSTGTAISCEKTGQEASFQVLLQTSAGADFGVLLPSIEESRETLLAEEIAAIQRDLVDLQSKFDKLPNPNETIAISPRVIAEAVVEGNELSNSENPSPGRYFVFDEEKLDAGFGHDNWHGSIVLVRNTRTNVDSWAIIWRSSPYVRERQAIGRYLSGSNASSWQLGDTFRVSTYVIGNQAQ